MCAIPQLVSAPLNPIPIAAILYLAITAARLAQLDERWSERRSAKR